MMGADICGFTGNTTVELCARWFQLGALYPFSRSHNDRSAIPQEPYALGDIVLQSAKNNLQLRYSLLKQFYSVIIDQGGHGAVFNPLFFHFPED